ncbi:hypothetical protein ACH5RR_025608 [Cinchona calisaya]|uniref:Uncharacterized protein n=1 Tax=Cinchona calisaya TaxID=153742 RepID=A0ABD2Z221_9GENT
MVVLIDSGLAEEMDNGVLTAIETSLQASSIMPISRSSALNASCHDEVRSTNLIMDGLDIPLGEDVLDVP